MYNLLINFTYFNILEGDHYIIKSKKKLYKLFNIQSKLVIIKLPNGLIKFRNILIKYYFNNNLLIDNY